MFAFRQITRQNISQTAQRLSSVSSKRLASSLRQTKQHPSIGLSVAGATLAAGGLFAALSYSEESVSHADAHLPHLFGSKKAQMNFIADAVEGADSSLVHITSRKRTIFGEVGSGGSGWVVSEDGFIATNAHVVVLGGSDNLKVTLNDGTEYDATVWAVDQNSDLALVKVDPKAHPTPLVPAKVGKSGDLRAGEWVVALGSPLNLQNSVTCGVVSSTARQAAELGIPNGAVYIQTDASINQGNSGGPLINLDGEVVGINSMKASGPEGISFAIPIDTAYPILQQLKEFKKVKRPYVGMRMVSIDAHVKMMEGKSRDSTIPEDQTDGVLVMQVAPGSPAERGGLRKGDVIIKMGEKKIKDANDAVASLGFEAGKEIVIKVRHGKEDRTVTVVPEASPTVQF